MNIGDTVRILHPFAESFPGEYVVERLEDGVVFVTGIEGGFDPIYLEVVQ